MSTAGPGDKRPLFFISHKHADKDIAKVFADFIDKYSGGRVRVHLSSSWEFDGPRFGSLNRELRKALWEAEALLLVYTNSEQDWSYCMYEWGVTQHSNSKPTRTVLFQCTKAVPAPLSDEVRYSATADDDVLKFVDSFLTDPDFFPGRTDPTTGFRPKSEQVRNASKELIDELRKVIRPAPASKPVRLWPFLRLELPSAALETLRKTAPDKVRETAKLEIEKHAVVVGCNGRAAEIFGRAKLKDGIAFSEALDSWRAVSGDRPAAWFDSLAMQVAQASQGLLPEVMWACMTRVGSDEEHLPVLSSTLEVQGGMQFELCFYELTALMRLPVVSKMIPKEEMFHLVLDDDGIRDQKIAALVETLTQVGRHRLPILMPSGCIRYVVHRATLDQYLVSKLIKKADLDSLTLGQLLDESPETRNLFERSFAIVSSRTTIEQAKVAMRAIPDCRDVLVTENGLADEPVIGWLTNLILT